jgi:hypothetical protein
MRRVDVSECGISCIYFLCIFYLDGAGKGYSIQYGVGGHNIPFNLVSVVPNGIYKN